MTQLHTPQSNQQNYEQLRISNPAIIISLGPSTALVDLLTETKTAERFINNRDRGLFFGATGWIAIGFGNPGSDSFLVAHPRGSEVSFDELRGGSGHQLVAYVSGANPDEIAIEALPAVDAGDISDGGTAISIVHERGVFIRPFMANGEDREPARWEQFTDRVTASGLGGVDLAVIHFALVPKIVDTRIS